MNEDLPVGTRVRITNVNGNTESVFVGYTGTVIEPDEVSELIGWIRVDMDSYPPNEELLHYDFLLVWYTEIELI